MRKYPINIVILVILGALVLTGVCFADQSITQYNQRFAPIAGNSGLIKFLQNSSHFSQGNMPQDPVITPVTPKIPDSTPLIQPVPSINPTVTRFKILSVNKNTWYQQPVVNPVQPGGTKTTPGNDTGKNVIEANNQFAFELFSDLNKNSGRENVFFSPFSISTAFALAYEGARGSTADQIQSVFHYPKDDTARRFDYSTFINGLNRGDSEYTLSTANAMWAEKTYPFLPEFSRIAQDYYNANTINLDFMSQPDASRERINTWVEDKTNNKIKDLLPAGSITPDTKLIITNALYFKGTWVTQFPKDRTKVDRFVLPTGKSIDVQMMQTQQAEAYNYAEYSRMQFLEMPYRHSSGNELSMLVVLPNGQSLAETENYLADYGLTDVKSKLASQNVMVYLPKFRIEATYSLVKDLTAMGMPLAFSSNADFSGMDGKGELQISDVRHKTFIDVNEEGTEGAAATEISWWATGVNYIPPPVFRVDHPFIFFIQDRDSGAILFMGRVMNPTSS
jgi:serpin B